MVPRCTSSGPSASLSVLAPEYLQHTNVLYFENHLCNERQETKTKKTNQSGSSMQIARSRVESVKHGSFQIQKSHHCAKGVSWDTPAPPWNCMALSMTSQSILGAATLIIAICKRNTSIKNHQHRIKMIRDRSPTSTEHFDKGKLLKTVFFACVLVCDVD